MANRIMLNQTSYHGAGAIAEIATEAKAHGFKKALVCSDPDLINWYFDKLLLKSFEHMGEGTTVYDGLVKKFEYLKEEHLFFAAAFRSDDQNSLKEHDFELILEFYSNLIFQKTGRRPDAETSFLLEMYCRGSIYMTVKWLLGGMKFPPAQLAKQLVLGMPEKLVQLFTDLHILS